MIFFFCHRIIDIAFRFKPENMVPKREIVYDCWHEQFFFLPQCLSCRFLHWILPVFMLMDRYLTHFTIMYYKFNSVLNKKNLNWSKLRSKKLWIGPNGKHLQTKKNTFDWEFNPLLHRYSFWPINNRQLLKTLWEKKKLLVTSNFSFSHNVFYSIR